MKCPRCGTKLKNSKNPFCIRCGYIEETKNNVDPELLYDLEKRKILDTFLNKLFLPLLIIIVIILICYSFINKELERRKTITPVNQLTNIIKNGDSFINNIYISDERAYNYLLNDLEKEVYRQILFAIENYKINISIDLKSMAFENKYETENCIKKILDSITIDHPELLQYANSKYVCDNNSAELNIKYAFTKDKYNYYYNLIKTKVDQIKNETNDFDDYKKTLYVYSSLAENKKYGSLEVNDSYSAISVCDPYSTPVYLGFSRAAQIFLQNVNITSSIVVGTLNGDEHSWNIVKLKNSYYNFDLSWSTTNNEPIENNISYSGFLFKNKTGYKTLYREIIPHTYGIKYWYEKD